MRLYDDVARTATSIMRGTRDHLYRSGSAIRSGRFVPLTWSWLSGNLAASYRSRHAEPVDSCWTSGTAFVIEEVSCASNGEL
jgi:hypothetical protein